MPMREGAPCRGQGLDMMTQFVVASRIPRFDLSEFCGG
jgi:hypothetical protein